MERELRMKGESRNGTWKSLEMEYYYNSVWRENRINKLQTSSPTEEDFGFQIRHYYPVEFHIFRSFPIQGLDIIFQKDKGKD